MAPRNPAIVQSDAPQLVSDLIKELQLIGPGVGLLGFSDQIAPVFIIGARGVVFEAQEPVFAPAEVFSVIELGIVGGTDILDTGQLEAGNFDVICSFAIAGSSSGVQALNLVQRNAGNTANVARWPAMMVGSSTLGLASQTPLKFSIRVLENERFIVEADVTDVGATVSAWLMVRRRADVS